MKSARPLGVAEGFGPLADTFFATIADDGRSGAALSIWLDGKEVVDLWAGVADVRTGRPFAFDTLSVLFSCTKGLASILIAMLIQRGEMPALDTPVVALWPEFGVEGKHRLTIGDVLSHRGGLSATRRDLPPELALDSLALADELAAQKPLWNPGDSHQYHTVTHGAITAMLVKRATGQSIGLSFEELIARPLHAEAWIGLPERQEARVSHLVEDPVQNADQPPTGPDDLESSRWVERAANVIGPIGPDVFNEAHVHRAELPGVGGIATASGLAKIWAATVAKTDEQRLISNDVMNSLREPRSEGPSHFLGIPPHNAWGAGVMIPSDFQRYLSPKSFGHDGAGGQVAFADPEARIGFAYVTNLMGDWERGNSVVRALAKALT